MFTSCSRITEAFQKENQLDEHAQTFVEVMQYTYANSLTIGIDFLSLANGFSSHTPGKVKRLAKLLFICGMQKFAGSSVIYNVCVTISLGVTAY